MSSTRVPYCYHALQNPRRYIRLLTAVAASPAATAQYRLEEVAIDSLPDFMALSYVWGDAAAAVGDLLVNDRIMKVRQNVYRALRRMRARQGSFAVWIDAICINQDDPDERAAQVSIMRQIYESATRVIVYLGENPDCRRLINLLSKVSSFTSQLALEPEGYIERQKIPWENLGDYGLPGVDSPEWQVLVSFLGHAWFSRAWIYQEFLVASRCSFIQGDLEINESGMFRLVYFIIRHNAAEALDRTTRTAISPMQATAQRLYPIYLYGRSSEVGRDYWTRQPLIRLLRCNTACLATDPRDRVFSFVGVSNEADEPRLQPDYTEDVEDTYIRVAKYMVDSGFAPLLLDVTTLDAPPDWPSWVPRWDEPANNNAFGIYAELRMSPIFAAARGSDSAFQCQDHNHKLQTRGIILDTIAHLGSTKQLTASNTTGLEDPLRMVRRIMGSLTEAMHMLQDVGDYYKFECSDDMIKSLARLTVCDMALDGQSTAPPEYELGLRRIQQIISESFVEPLLAMLQQEEPPGNRNCASQMLEQVCPEPAGDEPLHNIDAQNDTYTAGYFVALMKMIKTLIHYTTENKRIGKVLPHAKVKDRIAVLQGCDIPVVLRPKGNGEYTYVSTCYVHGSMYGESWDDQSIEDIVIC